LAEPVGAHHGGNSQAVLTQTLALFKDSVNAAPLATDVAIRGVRVDGISLVLLLDIPQDHKDYLHRLGHTARVGDLSASVILVPAARNR
jgi:superfamily II DNA/RNA helicase